MLWAMMCTRSAPDERQTSRRNATMCASLAWMVASSVV